jgi:hypothetical protein
MNVLVFFALFFGAMFLIPWLAGKFGNTKNGSQEKEQNHQRSIPPKRRHRKLNLKTAHCVQKMNFLIGIRFTTMKMIGKRNRTNLSKI